MTRGASAYIQDVTGIHRRERRGEGRRENGGVQGREGGERERETHSLMLRQAPKSSLEQYRSIVDKYYRHRTSAQLDVRVSGEDKGTHHLSHPIRLSGRPI